MRWVIAFLVTALCIFTPFTAAVGGDSTDTFDVIHYDLHFRPAMGKKTFTGSVGVTAIALVQLHQVVLDAFNATLTIDSVYSDDVKLDFTHADNLLTVNFEEPVGEKSQFEVSIFYHGKSSYGGQYDGGGVYFISPTRFATISEPNFSRTWWPCKDRPSDKASAHIQITVPDSLTALSNGFLKSTTPSGKSVTFEWETNYPTATYLIFAAAAPYVKYTERYAANDTLTMPVEYYVYPEDFEHAKIDFGPTLGILRYFSTTFRPYPFAHEKFGMAEVDGNMTMEHQTLCSIQKDMITGKRTFETTIVHETAHHWWGNFITPLNWKHTWLSEGFATYAEALYIEATAGKDSAQRYVRAWMGEEQGTYAGSVVGKSDTAFWDSFAPRVYNKGALVLHMLRGITGDSIFFAIMKNYLANPALAYANATTDDFVGECERGYGKPLRWFFDEWVYSSSDSIDRPEYAYTWESAKEGNGYRVTVHLDQPNASKQFYRMPIDITITSGSSTASHVVENTLPSQSFSFLSESNPSEVLLDPGEKILRIVRKGTKR